MVQRGERYQHKLNQEDIEEEEEQTSLRLLDREAANSRHGLVSLFKKTLSPAFNELAKPAETSSPSPSMPSSTFFFREIESGSSPEE